MVQFLQVLRPLRWRSTLFVCERNTSSDTTNNDTTNDTTTTSITDIENLMVSLYPNPSNGHFTIQSSSIIQSVEIFDVYGQKVAYFEGLGYHAEVDMIQPKGLYIVKVRHQEGDVILRHMLE